MKRILTNLLLTSVVILTSCSKEDDLLTPVNPTNTVQINDTTTYTVTGGDTTALCPWEPGYVLDEPLTNELNLEGSKWKVTYNSFHLNNRYPICPMPHDTLIFDEWYNMGEVYFSNQGDGYFETHTYMIDCEIFNEPLLNYWCSDPNVLINQPIERYVRNGNQIIVDITNSTGYQYKITLDIVEYTNNKLILENRNSIQSQQINGQGYPTDWNRDVRVEMEKIN